VFSCTSGNHFEILLNPMCFIAFLCDGESLQMCKIGASYILLRTLNAGQADSEVDSFWWSRPKCCEKAEMSSGRFIVHVTESTEKFQSHVSRPSP